MSAQVYSLFIDETGDTDTPGQSAVVGLLVDRMVGPEEQKALRKELGNLCTGLSWAIHAAALNTPEVFLRERRKRGEQSVVDQDLEPQARRLAAENLRPEQLRDWSLPGDPPASASARAAAAKLAEVTRRGREQVGRFLSRLGERLGAQVSIMATVCGPERPLEQVAGLVADGYVLALRRTFQTLAELVGVPDRPVNIDIHVLERDVHRADRHGTKQKLVPTHALRIAAEGVRRANVRGVSVSAKPHVYPWNHQTPAMLVLADHAANRFGRALAESSNDDLGAFSARIVRRVGVDPNLPGDRTRHGLAHLDRAGREAPLWARRLPPARDA
jgi:hypothetical protein